MIEIHTGDCIKIMQQMDSEQFQCCVTSPPYFGLRDYGHDGQIGLEKTPDEYVAKIVEVFREVKRVLRDDGTLWLNLGDSYSTKSKWGGSTSGKAAAGLHGKGGGGREKIRHGIPDKNLMGIPWRVAFALQQDGWYLRQDIIWHKPNPMPESVKDRCTKAHEYIFLLSKGPKYYFDLEAVKEEAVRGSAGSKFNKGKTAEHQDNRSSEKEREEDGTRNRRSVWTVATKPYKGAHFATFPPDLIRPCIQAGSRPGDTVIDPFGGSGTTGMVALEHGRKAVLIELNPEYAELCRERTNITPSLPL